MLQQRSFAILGVTVAALMVVVSACASRSIPTVSEAGVEAAPAAFQPRTANGGASQDALVSSRPLTLNVELLDTGFSPSLVSLPAGHPIRLVVRNRGTDEHHFHIVGLQPTGLQWMYRPEVARQGAEPSEVSEHETHTAHHAGELVPFHICSSRTGLCPTGNSVHAHAGPGEVDIVFFTAATAGTYQVSCPLHPSMSATAVVF